MNGKFYIVEVGYGGDTFYQRTKERKRAQHHHLCKLMREQGWQVEEPIPLIFGHAGTLYQSSWDALHKNFEVPPDKLKRLFGRAQKNAAAMTRQIIIARRKMEQEGGEEMDTRTHPRRAHGARQGHPYTGERRTRYEQQE